MNNYLLLLFILLFYTVMASYSQLKKKVIDNLIDTIRLFGHSSIEIQYNNNVPYMTTNYGQFQFEKWEMLRAIFCECCNIYGICASYGFFNYKVFYKNITPTRYELNMHRSLIPLYEEETICYAITINNSKTYVEDPKFTSYLLMLLIDPIQYINIMRDEIYNEYSYFAKFINTLRHNINRATHIEASMALFHLQEMDNHILVNDVIRIIMLYYHQLLEKSYIK